jgi:steroid delta-isomerase-like uncharacterized protein
MATPKTVARRWFEEVWNGRSAAAIDRLMSPRCVVHGLAQDGQDLTGPAGFRPFQQAFLSAFPDLRIEIEDLIEEGDRVVVRFTAAGTHTGDGLGFPATNARMRVSGMTIARVEDGVLTEGWNIFDSMGLLQQLGILPPPAAKW